MSTVKANTLEPASGGTITITGAALTTPALGTPASGNLANCTGLPASSVVNTPSGGISATTVQAALNELDSEKLDKSGGTISGNLGVGTSAPDRRLVVNGEIGFSYNGTQSFNGIRLSGDATEYFNGITSTASDIIHRFTGSSGATKVAITEGGEMQVATAASRSGKLVVGGNVWIIGSQLDVEPGAAQNFEIVNRVGGGFDFYVDNATKLGARMNADSQSWYTNGVKNLELGGTGALALDSVGAAVGDAVLSLYRTGYGNTGVFYQCDTGSPNAASTALKLWSAASGRSISASGTINASGADAAEYRKNNGLTIAKGQIVGYKNDGTLTLTWSEATMARVKSTDPHIVGGDTWGTEDQVGARPVEPKFTPPPYTGRVKPADLAPEPQAPAPFGLTAPTNPGDGAGAVAAAVYALALRDYTAAQQAHADSVSAHAPALAAWQSAAAQHAQEMVEWEEHQSQHDAVMRAAQQQFDTVTMPQYLADKAAFEARLEAARQQVDRIAYCGIVPCNVTGATPGHYIVAAEGPNDTITSLSVSRPTEDQWPWVVGRCLRVLPDGRAEIDVMLS